MSKLLNDNKEAVNALCECGCGRAVVRLGNRFIKGHSRRQYPINAPLYRVDRETGCWLWQRALFEGYGRYVVKGRGMNAHRAIYLLSGNSIPDGLHLDHLCERRSCVNPDHMEPVTQAENNRRQSIKNLSMSRVQFIRESKAPSSALARQMGLSLDRVEEIRRGIR